MSEQDIRQYYTPTPETIVYKTTTITNDDGKEVETYEEVKDPTEKEKEESRVVRLRVSDETLTSNNHLIKMKGVKFDVWNSNKMFLYNHDDLNFPLGKGIRGWRSSRYNAVMADCEFLPMEVSSRADTIHKMVKWGAIRGVSPRLRPDWGSVEYGKQDKEPSLTIHKCQLIEVSICNIPANSNALIVDKNYSFYNNKIVQEMIKKDVIDELEVKELDEWHEHVYKSIMAERQEEPKIHQVGTDIISSDCSCDGVKEPKLEEVLQFDVEDITLPYPNEHSCRLNDPKKYDEFRRQKCGQKSDGKCIDVIYGITGKGKERKSEIQALRYPKDKWSAADARAHCKKREGMKFEPAKDTKQSNEKIEQINSEVDELKLRVDTLEKEIEKSNTENFYRQVFNDIEETRNNSSDEVSESMSDEDMCKKIYQVLKGE